MPERENGEQIKNENEILKLSNEKLLANLANLEQQELLRKKEEQLNFELDRAKLEQLQHEQELHQLEITHKNKGNNYMTTNLQSIKPDRPNIITSEINGIKFYRKMDTESVVNQMIAGKSVIVEEYYSNGLQVLAELKKNLSLRYSDKSFQGQRAYRAAFREASHRLFIKVIDNKLSVKKAPDIG